MFFVLCSLWTIDLNAQFVCGFTTETESNFTPPPPNTICIPAGVMQGGNIHDNYIPFQGDDRDIITIELVFHTFSQSEANPMNFTEDDRHFFHEIVEVMSANIYGEINCPTFNTNGACDCDAAHCETEGGTDDCCVQDSKIRFTLADEDIHYWTDPLGWNNSGPGVNVTGCPNTNSYVWDMYGLEKDCKLNVFFINNISGYSGCGPGYNGEHLNMVLMNDTYLNYQAFENLDPQAYSDGRQQVVATLAHEIGHCFGLHHAGLSSQSGTNNGVGLFPDLYDYRDMLNAVHCAPADFNCSNNIMESAVIRNWFSPHQIAHMRRLHIGSWRSKQAKVDYDPAYSINITGDEEWNFGRVNKGDITIKSGAKLTISCKVLMAGNSTITVEKGGRLVVDGGHITMGQHKCGDYWKGIVVEGDLSASQFLTANQGRVSLKNGALIEYAEIAIDVDGGGWLYARDSRINNCELGVRFAPYQNFLPASGSPYRNLSSFSNCAFSVDENYTQPKLDPMVKMAGVDGITFGSCVFEDLRASVPSIDLTSMGILSFNAKFSVSGGGTLFHKMYIGIDAGVSGSIRNYSVIDATFKACYVGIVSRAVNSFIIKNNTFEVGSYDLYPAFLDGVGVSVASGTNFKLSGNTFNGVINSATIGIIAGDTGEANNHIERNDFAALSVGNYAEGNNINLINPSIGGLEYLCNKNTDDNRFDFYVSGEGIGIYQGSEDKSAGNTFNLNNNPAGSDFLNGNSGGWPVSYWYFDGDVFQNPTNTIGVFKETADINTCGKGKGDDFIKEEEYADYDYKFQQEKDAFLNFRNAYEGHINNGDTEALKSQLEAVTIATKSSVLAALQAASPYLSMEILKLCADQSAFTANNIKNIALLNPELLRNENVVQYIVAAGLNATQESELRTAAETQTTERKILESDMAASYGRMQEAGRKMIISLLSDTISLDSLALHNRLREQMDISSLYQDIELYWQQADYTSAFDLMNNDISNRISATSQNINDLEGLKNLKELHWKVLLEGRNWEVLSTDEITTLKDIADGWKYYAGNQAQHILNYYYGYNYLNLPDIPGVTTAIQNFSNPDNHIPIDQRGKAKNNLATITVSPNPANNNTWFNYSLPENTYDAVFKVYNISGEILFEQELMEEKSRILWQIPDSLEGIVFYSVEWSGNRTSPEKLVIIR